MNNIGSIVSKNELVKDSHIKKCKCGGKMIKVRDLYDHTVVGYSCENCPHYNLLDNQPV
jgi:hypothetical protein